jgi:hypothetical protein
MNKGGGRKRIYASDSERVAAYRLKTNKKTLTALISPELINRLNGYMLGRDETKSKVIERALANFFRKR